MALWTYGSDIRIELQAPVISEVSSFLDCLSNIIVLDVCTKWFQNISIKYCRANQELQ